MKKLYYLITLQFLLALLLFGCTGQPTQPKAVQFDNPIIEQQVRDKLLKKDEDVINEEDLQSVTYFYHYASSDGELLDLQELSMLANLESLDLGNCKLVNLTALSSLENLTNLFFKGCTFDSFPSLSKSSNLKYVSLSYCVGNDINGIDGFIEGSSFPVYSDIALLNPVEPDKVCAEIENAHNIACMIVDANDFGVNILGKSEKLMSLSEDFLQSLIKDNPAGQSGERTPLILVKTVASQSETVESEQAE